jgi:hypothetical protein
MVWRFGPQCMKMTGPSPSWRYAVAVSPSQRRADQLEVREHDELLDKEK